jgi:serine/threonine protein kinase
VHRDLKPANILISRGAGAAARIKVADFGISTLLADAEGRSAPQRPLPSGQAPPVPAGADAVETLDGAGPAAPPGPPGPVEQAVAAALAQGSRGASSRDSLTRTGVIMGTVRVLSVVRRWWVK